MGRRETPWNPNTADWLVKQRGTRTQDAVVADMDARGVKIKRAWLSRIENGAPFSDELLDAFRAYYGSEPPPFEPVREVTDPTLASSLSELAAELRASREGRSAVEERLRSLEAAVALLAPRDGAGHPERSVPQTREG